MFFTVTNNAHKSNKLLLARSKTRVFILKTPRGIVAVNSCDILSLKSCLSIFALPASWLVSQEMEPYHHSLLFRHLYVVYYLTRYVVFLCILLCIRTFCRYYLFGFIIYSIMSSIIIIMSY